MRVITGDVSADGRPEVHPAIATIDVSTMLNSPKASHRISTSKRFLDESGYTSGYVRRKQEALSQWERASDLLLRSSGGRI
jgi:hypothetical protein